MSERAIKPLPVFTTITLCDITEPPADFRAVLADCERSSVKLAFPPVGLTPPFEQLSSNADDPKIAIPHKAQDDFKNFLLSILIDFNDHLKIFLICFHLKGNLHIIINELYNNKLIVKL